MDSNQKNEQILHLMFTDDTGSSEPYQYWRAAALNQITSKTKFQHYLGLNLSLFLDEHKQNYCKLETLILNFS